MSTLSVETSRRGSSSATWSPCALSQRVTVPSVTDSPSAGIVTVVPPSMVPPESAGAAAGALAAGSGWLAAGSTAGAGSWGGAAWLMVAPAYRKRGIARTLLATLEAAAWDAGSASAGCCEPEASDGSPTSARSAPTGTVSSSLTRISSSTPATGDGISVSTLSVDTSSNGSSNPTWSPTDFNQRVTVPSVTDSPSAGMVTRSDMSPSFSSMRQL